MDCEISILQTLYTGVLLPFHQTAHRLLDTMKFLDFDSRNYIAYYVLVIGYLHLHYQQSSANPVCYTENCAKLGDYYHKNMNKQGAPCTDFYDYVCRNWGVHNPRPKYKTTWNVEHLQGLKSAEAIKHALENLHTTSGPYESAKGLYTACMNLPFMGRADLITLKNIMAATKYWPMFIKKGTTVLETGPWWDIDSYYLSKTGESSILDFYLIANSRLNNQITLLMAPLDSAHGMVKLYTPFDVSHRKQYKEFLMNVINTVALFNTYTFTDVISENLDDVIQFREELNKISKVSDVGNDSLLITMAEFQEYYDKHSAGRDSAKINWSEMIRALYKNSKNHYLLAVQNTPHMLVTLSYFSKLATTLANTPKSVIANHVHLYFAERHVELSMQMEKNLENSFIQGARPTGEIRYEREKWLQCMYSHNLLRPLGNMYIETHFPKESKKEVEDLLNELVRFLKIRISKSSWLNMETKLKTMNKLDNIRKQIGYPEWYHSVAHADSVPNTPDINPIDPDAFYVPRLNRIGASASFLQSPIFGPNMPYAVTYGATGSTLGHEISHATDNIGQRVNEFGLGQNVLSNSVYDQYMMHANCFVQEYKNYKNAELKKRKITQTPEENTLNEDIADVMGLKIAYMGYKEQLRKNNGTCPVLPNFETLGCEKLFFIAFANIFCSTSTPPMEERLLLRDTHNFPRIRVNGAVGNMKEFHEAFGCKPRDPKKMCDIWA